MFAHVALLTRQNQWLYCDTGKCTSSAGYALPSVPLYCANKFNPSPFTYPLSCPNDKNNRKVTTDSGCYGERYQIYAHHSGVLKNGDVVWIKSRRHKWLYCDTSSCKAAAGCPDNANNRKETRDTGCYGERFQIYNSQNKGYIQHQDVVWIKSVRFKW